MKPVTQTEIIDGLSCHSELYCNRLIERIKAHGIAPPEGYVMVPVEWRLPTTKRFSYVGNQPDNINAWRMGEACQKAIKAPSGDFIDTGLALLRELESKGFVIAAAPKQGTKP